MTRIVVVPAHDRLTVVGPDRRVEFRGAGLAAVLDRLRPVLDDAGALRALVATVPAPLAPIVEALAGPEPAGGPVVTVGSAETAMRAVVYGDARIVLWLPATTVPRERMAWRRWASTIAATSPARRLLRLVPEVGLVSHAVPAAAAELPGWFELVGCLPAARWCADGAELTVEGTRLVGASPLAVAEEAVGRLLDDTLLSARDRRRGWRCGTTAAWAERRARAAAGATHGASRGPRMRMIGAGPLTIVAARLRASAVGAPAIRPARRA